MTSHRYSKLPSINLSLWKYHIKVTVFKIKRFSLNLKFVVDGTRQTPVEAKLIKDGKVLSPKDVDVVVADDKIKFKIKKPARELSGPYQIKLSNGQGEDVKDCTINMQDVPAPPEDVDVTEVFQTSCQVSWKLPKDDGGAPLLHYIVERNDISLKCKKTSNYNNISIMFNSNS